MAMPILAAQALTMHVTCNAVVCPWPLEGGDDLAEKIREEAYSDHVQPMAIFLGKNFAINSLYYGLLPNILPWACRPLPKGEVRMVKWRFPIRWAILAAATLLLLLASFSYALVAYRLETFYPTNEQQTRPSLLKGEAIAHVGKCSLGATSFLEAGGLAECRCRFAFATQIMASFSVAFIVSLSLLMSDQPSIISTVGESTFMTLVVHQAAFNFFSMSFVLTHRDDESIRPCTRENCSPNADEPVSSDTLYSVALFMLVALFQVLVPKPTNPADVFAEN